MKIENDSFSHATSLDWPGLQARFAASYAVGQMHLHLPSDHGGCASFAKLNLLNPVNREASGNSKSPHEKSTPALAPVASDRGPQ